MWIQTYTGRKFYPLSPKVEDLDIIDIAHALSMKCRFTGHCREFYSVAEHSIHVANAVKEMGGDDDAIMWGLMHDAAEAYLPDVARPIKPSLDGFEEIERRILDVVAWWVRIPFEIPEIVNTADLRILAAERRDIMRPGPNWGGMNGILPFENRIVPNLSAQRSMVDFRNLFVKMCLQRGHQPVSSPRPTY